MENSMISRIAAIVVALTLSPLASAQEAAADKD